MAGRWEEDMDAEEYMCIGRRMGYGGGGRHVMRHTACLLLHLGVSRKAVCLVCTNKHKHRTHNAGRNITCHNVVLQ